MASIAMAHLTPAQAPEVLEREMRALASEAGGWDGKETDARLAAVFDRARMRQRGETIEWMGKPIDPLYRVRAETVVRRLAISREEMVGAGLRVLVDADRRRELATERQRLSRANRGIGSGLSLEQSRRAQAQSTEREIGVLADWLRGLMAQGRSMRAAAGELGITPGWASKVLARSVATHALEGRLLAAA